MRRYWEAGEMRWYNKRVVGARKGKEKGMRRWWNWVTEDGMEEDRRRKKSAEARE